MAQLRLFLSDKTRVYSFTQREMLPGRRQILTMESLEGTSVNAHGVINSDIEFTPIHKHWRSACVCVHVCESPRVAVREPHVHAVLAGEGVCAEESV